MTGASGEKKITGASAFFFPSYRAIFNSVRVCVYVVDGLVGSGGPSLSRVASAAPGAYLHVSPFLFVRAMF